MWALTCFFSDSLDKQILFSIGLLQATGRGVKVCERCWMQWWPMYTTVSGLKLTVWSIHTIPCRTNDDAAHWGIPKSKDSEKHIQMWVSYYDPYYTVQLELIKALFKANKFTKNQTLFRNIYTHIQTHGLFWSFLAQEIKHSRFNYYPVCTCSRGSNIWSWPEQYSEKKQKSQYSMYILHSLHVHTVYMWL